MMAAYKFLGSLLVLRTIKANPCAPPQIRLRNNTLNKTIAVVLRGEAFRNTGQQHVRGTCGCALRGGRSGAFLRITRSGSPL